MINLPQDQFKEYFVDESHDFIKEATRRRNYSEPCWCGSELVYKKCHRQRSSSKPISIGQAQNEKHRIFWSTRECMHPNASPEICQGGVIDAHTIQRKGPLAKIVDATGHVQYIEKDFIGSSLEVKPLGWRKASIFPGYCIYHDSELFRDLETGSFTGTQKQCVLQAYRNVCNELYKKRALIDSLEYYKRVLDLGKDLDRQIEIQLSLKVSIEGNSKSVQELEQLQTKFHHAILNEDWDSFESKVYFFEGELNLVSAAVIQIDYDFDGNQYVDLFDLEQDAETMSYCIQATEKGGAIVFCWPKESEYLSKFIESFDSIDDQEKGDIFAQYCFLSSENTYFSKEWWAGFSEDQISQIYSLYQCFFYEGGKFVPSKVPLINWRF